MYVCVCCSVTSADIARHLSTLPPSLSTAEVMASIQQSLGATTGCGKCVESVKDMVLTHSLMNALG